MTKKELNKIVSHYKFVAEPSNADRSAPATINDVKKLIDETAKLILEVVPTED